MTLLLEAHSPAATAPRMMAAISGGKAMLIISAVAMGTFYGNRQERLLPM